MINRIRTIDAHAAGEPLRLVIDGMPSPEGGTIFEKRAWAMKQLDHLPRTIMLEPRGHAVVRMIRRSTTSSVRLRRSQR